jgi:hypothetical protein
LSSSGSRFYIHAADRVFHNCCVCHIFLFLDL